MFDAVVSLGGKVRGTGTDLGGVQLARSDGVCSVDSLRGADVGQDLSIGADLLVSPQPDGHIVTAGPYLRSRAAAPGDGIIGGTSAGYWVQLYSTGVVKVRRLNPQQIVAFAAAPAGFDASRFHRLEIAARGLELGVTLDGKVVEFDQGGRMVRAVAIPPAWEGPPPSGYNRGTAGIAFGAEPRGAGGQQARHITVTALAPGKR